MTVEEIEKIKNYIDEHIDNMRIASDLPQKFYYSYTALAENFKEMTGENIKSYVLRKRIETVRKHIESGKMINESFVLAGYSPSGARTWGKQRYIEIYGERPSETKRRVQNDNLSNSKNQ